jgi:hypothetical protein
MALRGRRRSRAIPLPWICITTGDYLRNPPRGQTHCTQTRWRPQSDKPGRSVPSAESALRSGYVGLCFAKRRVSHEPLRTAGLSCSSQIGYKIAMRCLSMVGPRDRLWGNSPTH